MKQLLLTLLGVLLMVPTFASDFQYEYEGQILSYTVLDEETKTVTVEKYESPSGNLKIPKVAVDRNTEYSVTTIGSDAFSDCRDLTTVEIPNSVTSIGDRAFSYCYGLKSVEIPNSVTSIAYSDFSECISINTI